MQININVNKIYKNKHDLIKKNQILMEEQIIKDSNYYVPVRDHYLETSVINDWASHKGKGFLKWNVPYAHRLYEGEKFNFSKDKNINARYHWFEEAKKNKLKTWLKIGNGGFNG